ncbi:MAG: antitoxin AF2212-like protein [Bryobacteraceae bacterium]
MPRQLEAVYEQGVLRPLEPLALPEHQRVRLTLEETFAPLSRQSSGTARERTEELRWLEEQSGPYAGKWVALDGPRLIAHGDELAMVRAAARAAGVERPLLTHVAQEGELPFGGW